MENINSHEIIVERTLEASNLNGEKLEIVISFEKPQIDPKEGGDWYCSFHIKSENINENKTAYGIDPIHAFILSLKMADALLKYLSLQNKIEITWLDEAYINFFQNT